MKIKQSISNPSTRINLKSGTSVRKSEVFRRFCALLFSLVLFCIAAAAEAQNRAAAFPRLQPDPKAIEYYNLGQRSGGYSWTDLAEISLWASGDTGSTNIERIRSIADAIRTAPDLPGATRDRADFILNYMHRNILRSYSLHQTRIDTMLTSGRFNCVSSAILYMILCESLGIRTSGVVTKDHAFVIVRIGGENIDVETTNAFGFDPGNRREFHDQFGRIGFTYVPAQNYRDRQTINQIELVSLIFVNRIADHERQNRFAESVPIAIDRAALLRGGDFSLRAANESAQALFTDPASDVMDRIFNFGALLLRTNREEEGLRWAETASPLFPDQVRWQEFILAAVNNNTTRLIRANRIADARNFLESQRAVLSPENYSGLDSIVRDSELLHSANLIQNAADGDAVLNSIVRALGEGKITEARANELITFSIQKTAAVLSAPPERNWRAAISFMEAATAHFGTNRELDQSLQNYKNNLAADYHNRFAAEWNRRNYAEAERILNEGLAEFPNNRQLLNNRATVERNR